MSAEDITVTIQARGDAGHLYATGPVSRPVYIGTPTLHTCGREGCGHEHLGLVKYPNSVEQDPSADVGVDT